MSSLAPETLEILYDMGLVKGAGGKQIRLEIRAESRA